MTQVRHWVPVASAVTQVVPAEAVELVQVVVPLAAVGSGARVPETIKTRTPVTMAILAARVAWVVTRRSPPELGVLAAMVA